MAAKRENGIGEFDIIARYFAPLATNCPRSRLARRCRRAAARRKAKSSSLTCDTIVEGVHFLKDDPSGTIGHKALAVNLSDLAAKGARPYVYLLALGTSGEPDAGLARGLRLRPSARCKDESGIIWSAATPRGRPGRSSITITALGLVPQATRCSGSGAKRGDRLYVTRHDRRCRSRPSAAARAMSLPADGA